MRVEVAIKHRSGLTNGGRRPPGGGDRVSGLQEFADRRTRPDFAFGADRGDHRRELSFGLGAVGAHRHRPVAPPVRFGIVPMKTRSSNEPALRWRIEPATTRSSADPAQNLMGNPMGMMGNPSSSDGDRSTTDQGLQRADDGIRTRDLSLAKRERTLR